MTVDIKVPALGESVTEATVAKWFKQPGDAVARGDIIAVVDTQKGAIEIEVFEDGTLEQLHVQPGATVPVGTVLATIRGRDARPAAPSAGVPAAPAPPPPSAPAAVAAAEPDRHVRVSPLEIGRAHV